MFLLTLSFFLFRLVPFNLTQSLTLSVPHFDRGFTLDNDVINQYDGLIFDMDGTVIDTMPSHAKAWEMVGQHFGYPFNGNLLYEMGGAPVKTIALEMMKRHAMPLDQLNNVIELKREYGKELIMKHATLLPAANVVRSFYAKKPLALGTGSHRAMTEILLDKFDFEKYFSAIVTAEDIQNHKPAHTESRAHSRRAALPAMPL